MNIDNIENLKKELSSKLQYFKTFFENDDYFLLQTIKMVCTFRQHNNKDYMIESEQLIEDIYNTYQNFSDNLITLMTWLENNKHKND